MINQPIALIGYSHRDEAEKDDLIDHLGVLPPESLIAAWSDNQIGTDLRIRRDFLDALGQVNILVLIITAHFLNSRFINNPEMLATLKQRQYEGMKIIPIIARPCAWRAIDLLRCTGDVRPQNNVPVWSDGGSHVAEDLSLIAEEMSALIREQTFKIQLTKQVSLSEASLQPTLPVLRHKDRSWRVLTIEDEPGWQKRLTRILREINCTVVTADSYEQALELLSNITFDLITIDLNLDKSTQYSDGLELVPRIQELFGTHLPIIVITGTGDLDDQRRAFKEFNVFDFIQKGKLDYGEFKGIVAEAIGLA